MTISYFFPRIYQKKHLIKGSFLADVLISMFVLMTSLSIGYNIISNALIAHSYNKNKIIAINIAREGIEAVRLIRDTNWIQYGTKKRLCWNYWNNTNEDKQWDTSDTSCTENMANNGQSQHPLGLTNDGTRIKGYVAVLDTINYNWALVENFYQIQDAPAINMTGNPKTCDYSILSNGGTCTNWATRKDNTGGISSLLYIDNFTSLYTHHSADKNGVSNTATKFYREIYIEYPLNLTVGEEKFFPTGEPALDNQMTITVKVWYPQGNRHYSSVTIETELTDYYGRTNWSE